MTIKLTERVLARYLGRHGQLNLVEGLKVPVVVEDAQIRFDRLELLVEPVGGEGAVWTDADRVSFEGARDDQT